MDKEKHEKRETNLPGTVTAPENTNTKQVSSDHKTAAKQIPAKPNTTAKQTGNATTEQGTTEALREPTPPKKSDNKLTPKV